MTPNSSAKHLKRSLVAPIFILGMQRGGTTQFLNILRSHPATFWPEGELQLLFRVKSLKRKTLSSDISKLLRYLPFLATVGDIFNPHRPPKTDTLLGWRGKWLDYVIHNTSKSNMWEVDAYKQSLVDVGFIEKHSIVPERLVIKLMNYHIGLAPELHKIYPDAKFIGILRDPFSLTESRMVRGAPVLTGTSIFNYVEENFTRFENNGMPITTFRFEDLVRSSDDVAKEILRAADLPLDVIKGVCLEDRARVMNETGRVVNLDMRSGFYRFGEIQNHMRPDVLTKSIEKLDPISKEQIAKACAVGISRRGYSLQSAA